jgi:1-deoxy-D-xylulose-5-phosphate reductoisomerase
VNQLRRNVAVFGCTGSIGLASVDVIQQLGKPYRLFAATANQKCEQLEKIIADNQSAYAVIADPTAPWTALTSNDSCVRLRGADALVEVARHPDVDIVIAAIVGSAGLESCLAAAAAGKRLALANKEALVVAGPLLTSLCKKSGAELLPVDSEHSAIYQCLQTGQGHGAIAKLVLTASGGSLRSWPIEKLSSATVSDALNHPTWKMGAKITIDSATMMNKALEIIEARWLFGVEASQISVVIHPQSIIHSMVEFIDGSVVAQLSPPDMRLPIQYALTYPERLASPARKLDWTAAMDLNWYSADFERYPALRLGFEVAAAGGSTGAVLNAANEAAVELFLDEKLKFTDITAAVRDVLQHHNFVDSPTLTELIDLDAWARREVLRWTQARKGHSA